MNANFAAIVPELTLREAQDGRLDPLGLHQTGNTVRIGGLFCRSRWFGCEVRAPIKMGATTPLRCIWAKE